MTGMTEGSMFTVIPRLIIEICCSNVIQLQKGQQPGRSSFGGILQYMQV